MYSIQLNLPSFLYSFLHTVHMSLSTVSVHYRVNYSTAGSSGATGRVCTGGTTRSHSLRNYWLCTFILNGNVCVLLRPGLAALNNLTDKFVTGWLLPSKVLDLSYPIPLPLLVFVIQRAEYNWLARVLLPEGATVAKTAFLSIIQLSM